MRKISSLVSCFVLLVAVLTAPALGAGQRDPYARKLRPLEEFIYAQVSKLQGVEEEYRLVTKTIIDRIYREMDKQPKNAVEGEGPEAPESEGPEAAV